VLEGEGEREQRRGRDKMVIVKGEEGEK